MGSLLIDFSPSTSARGHHLVSINNHTNFHPRYHQSYNTNLLYIGVVQKAPFLGNTDTKFPHHAEGDFVVKTIKPEVAVAPSHR
jgi:hypothetical protein